MLEIAIHHRPGSFSDRWLAGCAPRGVKARVVDAYRSDVVRQLDGAAGLLWHFGHGLPVDLMIARYVLQATAQRMPVFPDAATCWHFDDKVAQKYLLESVGAPVVPTWVFYDLESALAWIDRETFPKVFKLRRGSGSRNVQLVRTRDDARALARRAFSQGFRPSGGYVSDAWKLKKFWDRGELMPFLRSIPGKVVSRRRLDHMAGREVGYLYFQEFIADNAFDTRVTIIGDRAFAFTRNVRPGDFRASGSGRIVYDRARIPLEYVATAFRVCRAVGAQSMAFDFLRDPAGQPLIGEVSYGYDAKPVHDCEGHWDERLTWHAGNVWPEEAILDDLIERARARRGADADAR